jgi:hypothetical protein
MQYQRHPTRKVLIMGVLDTPVSLTNLYTLDTDINVDLTVSTLVKQKISTKVQITIYSNL